MTSSQVYTKLKDSAVDLGAAGYDNYYGWGRIDASKALATEKPIQIDTTPPVITLLGSSPVSVTFGSTYVDAGATALDNIDGDITGSIVTVNPVNTLVVGTYTVTYDVSDAAGNAAAQVKRTVNVVDATPPATTIRTPLDGSTVSGSVTASVDATDNVGVSKVALYVDDQLYGEDVNTPYDFVLDTIKLQNGAHLIKAVAYDINGNTASSQITINVSNASATVDTTPPTVSITNLADGSSVKGTVTVSVLAADSSGISRVELYVDGALKATLTKQPYDFSLNTRSAKDGLHTVIATAYDAYTNSASATISVTVTNRK